MQQPDGWSTWVLRAGMAAGMVLCLEFEYARNAKAFESQFDVSSKTGPSRDTISFKGQVRDAGWFSLKADGSILDLNPMRSDALAMYGFKMTDDPTRMEKTTVSDSRVTLGVWDDWVRWTSRQAFSNYVKPGSIGYFNQTETGFDRGASSQRLETSVFRTDSMRLSLFVEYARVGANFVAPDTVIKRQDPFSKSNSATTRFGSIIEQGPITFSLEQRAQQSLTEENAPILTQNQVGASLNLDELFGRNGGARQGLSWVVPSSAWLNVGRGRVGATLSQGVNGDTTSDIGFGFLWNVGKVYANVGYWRSEYQSQLYPWKGSGINGSLGYHEGTWGIDMYFDVGSSLASSYYNGLQPMTTKTTDVTSGILWRTHF